MPLWVNWWPWPWSDGAVLWPFIFLKEARTPTFRHEKYHWREILRWLVLPWYVVHVPIGIYYKIVHGSWWLAPFEQRAIAAEADESLDTWGGP